jgi:hypothetical protein
MDIFAHTLWTNAVARGANSVADKKFTRTGEQGGNKQFHLNVGWTAFWGVFPDLFAFTIPSAIRIISILTGGTMLSNFFQRPSLSEESLHNGFSLAHDLYQYSHSLIIWAIVFLIVWAIFKRPRYELLGWALHILIDIPSHALAFYPTPFLFPISNYHFPYGVPWSNQWYMLINYSALLIIWGRIFFKKLAKKVI